MLFHKIKPLKNFLRVVEATFHIKTTLRKALAKIKFFTQVNIFYVFLVFKGFN